MDADAPRAQTRLHHADLEERHAEILDSEVATMLSEAGAAEAHATAAELRGRATPPLTDNGLMSP